MSSEFENRSIGGEESMGGYFITEAIRERMLQNPDYVVTDDRGKTISLVFGSQIKPEDPPFSVYCRIVDRDGSSQEIAAGGRTRDDALKAAGLKVYRLVKSAEQIISENGKNSG